MRKTELTLLGSEAGHRLEPMAEVSRAFTQRPAHESKQHEGSRARCIVVPFFHRVCNLICEVRVQVSLTFPKALVRTLCGTSDRMHDKNLYRTA
jgi:hypothetical protein